MNRSVTLRRAREGDLPALTALWEAVFGDDEDFIRAFYKASGFDRTIVALADSQTVGMINCPAIELWASDERYRGAYIYALAVDPRYRSAGIGSALLSAAEGDEYLPEAPRFLLLIPAEASLFEFYAEKGYDRPAFAPLIGEDLPEIDENAPLAHDGETLYGRYLAACKQEAAKGAVFVKEQAIFALSMADTDAYATEGGYAALDKHKNTLETRPASPDLSCKKALWKAMGDISKGISPIISRFMEE